MSAGEEMYRKHILDHYKHPRNFGTLEDADIDHREENPLCGDDIRIMVRVGDEGVIDEIRFHGRGCAICQASTSLLTERVSGQTLTDAKAITRDDVTEMLGIAVTPLRLKCALLPLMTLQDGIGAYEAKQDGK